MAKDDWEQIHESEEQAREAELRARDPDFHGQPDQATLKWTRWICFAGLVPPVIVAVAWKFAFVSRFGPITNRLGALICLTAGFAMVYAPLGVGCSFLAHRLCRGTTVSERQLAVALALLVDVTLFGWLLCLFLVPV